MVKTYGGFIIFVFFLSCSTEKESTSEFNGEPHQMDTSYSDTPEVKAPSSFAIDNNKPVIVESSNSKDRNEVEVPDLAVKAIQNTDSSICRKCNFDILALLEGTKEKPSQDAISSFVCTFSKDKCAENVEFEEFYTELLFDLLAYSPKKLLNSLSKTNLNQRLSIIKMMESPVNDLYEISELIDTINSVSLETDTRATMLDALEIAKSKMN